MKEEDTMQPDPANLVRRLDLATPLIGFYDAPDPEAFGPLVAPKPGVRACLFASYKRWLRGETVHITAENPGCGGAGRWLCGVESRARGDFIRFLADEEGLRASHALMEQWIDHRKPYTAEYPNLLIGPLKPEQYGYLKTVTFYANADQLAALVTGSYYNASPCDPAPVTAPFGSGCGQIVPLFDDLNVPQAIIGATDSAMRRYLPADVLAFTVTKPMFRRLCELDERSFLYKSFWLDLRKARGLPDL